MSSDFQQIRFDRGTSPVSAGTARAEIAIDRSLFCAVILMLTCFGIVAVHTSSVTTRQEGFEPIFLTRHLSHLVIAAFVLVATATRPASFWKSLPLPLGLLTAALLALVLVPGIGLSAGGATRWLPVPGFSVQPSEWAKLAIPILVASQFAIAHRTQSVRRLATLTAVRAILVLACIAMVLKQPDLGTSLLLIASAGVALWYSGVAIWWFIAGGAGLIPLIAMMSLKGYQIRRITGLIDTWRDWHEAPYQLRQSLIALGEGGVNGVGLGRGWQKLSFLPESHTDFVVAVIGEELGFIGVALLAAFWIVLLLSGLSMCRRCGDRFGRVVSQTLLTMIVLQAALNVAVVAAVVPPTGIPHPLLSYGGNSLLVTATSLGIVWSLSSDTTQTTRQQSVPSEPMVIDHATTSTLEVAA